MRRALAAWPLTLPGVLEAVSLQLKRSNIQTFYLSVIGFGSTRRHTNGTTTVSNAEEDYDRKTVGDKVYYIKPKSLYPDRDDGREK